MLVIMMSPSISDTKPKTATFCEQKEKYKNQQTKDEKKKHFEIPELDE